MKSADWYQNIKTYTDVPLTSKPFQTLAVNFIAFAVLFFVLDIKWFTPLLGFVAMVIAYRIGQRENEAL